MEEMRVVGVTSDSSKCWLQVHLSRPTVIAALWAAAAEQHLQVIASQFNDQQVSAFIEKESVGEWKKLLSNLATQGFVEKSEVREDWGPVSIVGDRFSQDGSALQQVFEVLVSAGVSFGAGSASALAITVAVPQVRMSEAVLALHEALVENSSQKGKP